MMYDEMEDFYVKLFIQFRVVFFFRNWFSILYAKVQGEFFIFDVSRSLIAF